MGESCQENFPFSQGAEVGGILTSQDEEFYGGKFASLFFEVWVVEFFRKTFSSLFTGADGGGEAEMLNPSFFARVQVYSHFAGKRKGILASRAMVAQKVKKIPRAQ